MNIYAENISNPSIVGNVPKKTNAYEAPKIGFSNTVIPKSHGLLKSHVTDFIKAS